MALNIGGAPALPVNVVTDGRPVIATVAYPVHTFAGLAAVTGGRKVLALPAAQPIIYITANDLVQNGGKYHLSAQPVSTPIVTGLGLETNGGPAVAVYEA